MKGIGTNSEGVQQFLTQIQTKGGTTTYWAPSKPNFANIDAAVVIGQVLYVFQYTKGHRHGFNEDTFWQDFVSVVYYQVQFTRIHVYVVGMDGVSPHLTVNFNRQLATNLSSSINTRNSTSQPAYISIQCDSSVVDIDTTTAETFRSTASKEFSFSFSSNQ